MPTAKDAPRVRSTRRLSPRRKGRLILQILRDVRRGRSDRIDDLLDIPHPKEAAGYQSLMKALHEDIDRANEAERELFDRDNVPERFEGD